MAKAIDSKKEIRLDKKQVKHLMCQKRHFSGWRKKCMEPEEAAQTIVDDKPVLLLLDGPYRHTQILI